MSKHVFCLGEVLIDFTAVGESTEGKMLFEQNAGGAPANVACALAKLGASAYLCGKVGEDMFGHFLRETLRAEGVNTANLKSETRASTTLAFVSLDKTGERSFAFVRNPGADTCLQREDITIEDLQSAAVLHYGTLSLTHQPARSTLLEAIAIAESAGVITSLDVNMREPLWVSLADLYQAMHTVLPSSNIVKMSEEELRFATATRSATLLSCAHKVLNDYSQVKLLLVTLGSNGSMAFWRSGGEVVHLKVDSFTVPVVDTTGAGDAFMAGMLYHVVNKGLEKLLSDRAALENALVFANACGALAATKRGAIAAMPTICDVDAMLAGQKQSTK